MSKKAYRNNLITDDILNGGSPRALSVLYDLHPNYVRRITINVCRQRNPEKAAEIEQVEPLSLAKCISLKLEFIKSKVDNNDRRAN